MSAPRYFLLPLQISRQAWQQLQLEPLLTPLVPASLHYRLQLVAGALRRQGSPAASGMQLQLFGLLNDALRHVAGHYLGDSSCTLPEELLAHFVRLFPGEELLRGEPIEKFLRRGGDLHRRATVELFLLATQTGNRAAQPARLLFDDRELQRTSRYRQYLQRFEKGLRLFDPSGAPIPSLLELLAEPLREAPDSLAGQLRFVSARWRSLLPPEWLDRLPLALAEAEREFFAPTGATGFDSAPGVPDSGQPWAEPEAFSADSGWMNDVVMIAKSTHVWLHQLSQRHGRSITRIDQLPGEELDQLAEAGINTLWLIGLWERSSASQRLKQLRGNPEAVASAYSLYDYRLAAELGGEEALASLREQCRQRGLRLASDVVPNHTGLYSRWIKEYPDWYIQLDHPPYPDYRFNGPDLSPDPELCLQIEDGYYDHTNAAVVFRHYDRRSGRERFIYHGNDGTHMPWNDTAQLDYLNPEVREAMIRTIIAVAKRFPVIRFDAAMTLAKKHYQRLWYPQPGGGAGIPSRGEHSLSMAEFERRFPVEFWREVVDRIAAEVPDTLLIAEAFWLMEGYFVRTLGMHRVYNSAFMNMLKQEENAKYRQVLQEILLFNPGILKRFVNFMNNPDEATAVAQFGKGDKYFGVATLLATMPGLPMFGHGQLEGLEEKYGMEYRRAYRDERVDTGFLDYHRSQVFPLLRRRRLFSGAELFQLFDFNRGGQIDDNVFAFVNGQGSERALVVYHNRDASTAGRIERSVAKRQHGEGSEPVQVGLAEALGLAAGRRLIRFREQHSNLWYLRTEEELAGGLELTLGAYDFQVFLDFSRVNDPGGHWRHLWHTLAGAPCADPDRAVRQQIAGPLAGQFVHLLRQFATGAATKQQRKQFDLELLEVYAQLRSLCGLPEHPEIALERAGTARAALHRLTASRTKGSGDRLLLGRLQAAVGEILRAWLLLAATCTPPDSRNDLDLIAWWCGDLGLAGAIAEASPVPGAATLFQLLLRYSGRLARGETGAVEQLAADPQRQELPEGKQGVRRLHDLLLAAVAVTWLWTGRSDAAMLRLATGLARQLEALPEDDR